VGTHARVTVTSLTVWLRKKELWLRNLTSVKKKECCEASSFEYGFVRISFRDVVYNFSFLLGKRNAFKSYFFTSIYTERKRNSCGNYIFDNFVI